MSQVCCICPFSCCLYVEEWAVMTQVLGLSSRYRWSCLCLYRKIWKRIKYIKLEMKLSAILESIKLFKMHFFLILHVLHKLSPCLKYSPFCPPTPFSHPCYPCILTTPLSPSFHLHALHSGVILCSTFIEKLPMTTQAFSYPYYSAHMIIAEIAYLCCSSTL